MGENSYIYDKIKPPTMGRRILRENIENTSVKEFKKFIEIVKREGLFQGVQWGFTDGHASRYLPFEIFKKMVEKQIEASKKTNSPITNYWVWKIGDPWTKKIDKDGKETRLSPEIDKAIDGGLAGILTLGVNTKKFDRENKTTTDWGKIGTNFTSKNKEEFAKAMSKGEFGSLDEEEETSGVSLAALGQELADEMESLLSKKNKELEESDIVVTAEGILSTVLASTTFTNIISGWVGSFMKKRNFKKGAKGADKIYDFTHKLESLFKYPIKLIVGRFTKDKKVIAIVTNSIYALLILTLGVRAGGAALEAASLKNAGAGAVKSLKAALKGKDLATLIKDIASVAKAAV